MNIVLAGPYPEGTLKRFSALLPGHRVTQILNQPEYEAMADAECIVVRILKTPKEVIERNPNLKAIIRWGAGYDSVDIEAAGANGVLVANTPGTNAYAVAELAVGMMVALGRKLFGYCSNVQRGIWDRGAYGETALSLNRKTVGVIGGGNIGRRVARLVQAFGAEVFYYDAFRLPEAVEQEAKMTYVPLERLLGESDVVTLHIPLMDSTHHILGQEQLSLMKPTALLINTARGGLIDDTALLGALIDRRLAGAGLDCVEDEGSAVTARLLTQPNILVTPHVGGSTADLADEMIPTIVEQILLLAEGKPIDHVVNREFLPAGPTSNR